jgi:hypothetical protein
VRREEKREGGRPAIKELPSYRVYTNNATACSHFYAAHFRLVSKRLHIFAQLHNLIHLTSYTPHYTTLPVEAKHCLLFN